MEKRKLRNSGLGVSALSLGCMGYGKARELRDRAEMIALIRFATASAFAEEGAVVIVADRDAALIEAAGRR